MKTAVFGAGCAPFAVLPMPSRWNGCGSRPNGGPYDGDSRHGAIPSGSRADLSPGPARLGVVLVKRLGAPGGRARHVAASQGGRFAIPIEKISRVAARFFEAGGSLCASGTVGGRFS